MKTLLENDFIVSHGFEPISAKDAKGGDIIPHKGHVYKVQFFHRIPSESGGTFIKIELTNHDLRAMKKAMDAIESEVKDLEYSSLPF